MKRLVLIALMLSSCCASRTYYSPYRWDDYGPDMGFILYRLGLNPWENHQSVACYEKCWRNGWKVCDVTENPRENYLYDPADSVETLKERYHCKMDW